MKKVIIILSATIMLTGCNVKSTFELTMEYAYHQGQVDALNGDIKIDSTSYYWIESPWDDGSTPTYIYGQGELGAKAKNRNEIKYGRKQRNGE